MPATSMIQVELVNADGAALGKVDLPDGGTIAEALDQLIEDKKERRGVVGVLVSNGAEHVQGIEQPDGSKLADTFGPLHGSISLRALDKSDPLALQILRHSAAHLMADAIRRLWPETRLWVGPAVEDGFYYDVDCPHAITEEDFKAIEKEMKAVSKKRLKFERQQLKRLDALKRFKDEGDPYKVDLLERFTDDEVSLYTHGEFTDLCRGPHVFDTGYLGHVKLMKVAGAYWKGDANNKQLQRIYGTAFFEKDDLAEHLRLLEEAQKRDHRRLGKDMDLFSFSEYAPGMPFFHPRGVALLNVMIEFSREEHRRRDYIEIITPQIMSEELWKTSGHADYYAENMFASEAIGHESVEEGEEKRRKKLYIKPMNCPGCMLYYGTKRHSYAEFPLKIAEFGKVHRQELSGVTHGMLRVKGFTQDDAHIFCTVEQLQQQILEVLEFVYFTYQSFGFTDIRLELSTRPEKYVGELADWDRSEEILKESLKVSGKEWRLNPGDGAFYGPKIDVHVRDALKRSWQLGTIQVDFNLPHRFDLTYQDSDGEFKRPIMIHRAIFGSFERFYGILIEQHAGQFPVWMAPVQVKVLPITEKHVPYAQKVLSRLQALGLRAEGDFRNERIGKKIREAAISEKVPYQLVLGDDEESKQAVAVRGRGEGKEADLGTMSLDDFVKKIVEEATIPHAAG